MEGLLHYKQEYRPWGNLEFLTNNEPTTIKILTLAADGALSLQTHEHRDEFWRVIKGFGIVRLGEKENDAREGDAFFIPRHSKHRAISGPEGMTLLEIAFGTSDEGDITRLEDQYGRA